MAGPGDDADPGAGGFLSRWSRRKVLVRQGTAPAAPPDPPRPAPPAPPSVLPAAAVPAANPTGAPEAAAAEAPPPPTWADVALLDHQSDFSRFVAPGVDTGVKNAALKKLFSDPHFNVMDRLDTYIDDYGQPDPLPAGMLRQMAQSQYLGLFTDEPEPGVEPPASSATPPSVTGPVAGDPPAALPTPPSDEDPDLRLQPLDAAGPAGPDQGPGPDPGRQH